MNELLSLTFWFNSRPEAISHLGQKILASISAIMGLIYIIVIIRAYSEKLNIYKPSIERLLSFSITNIIICVYIAFVNYELIPVLRSRIWYIIWSIIEIIWLFVITKDFFKKAKRREILAKEAEMKKYLP